MKNPASIGLVVFELALVSAFVCLVLDALAAYYISPELPFVARAVCEHKNSLSVHAIIFKLPLVYASVF